MIQANELRIGNLVSFYGKFEKVESIGTYGVSFKNGFAKYTLPNLKPTPLTEEIILKCGFEKQEECKYYNEYKINHNNFISYDIDDCFFTYYNNLYALVEIKYLHQLQNLYHTLTGQELKIEL